MYNIKHKIGFSMKLFFSYNNKTYAVDDIDFNRTALDTFEKRDGTKISFAEYINEVRF